MCLYRSYSNARVEFMRSHYKRLGIRKKYFNAEMPLPDVLPQIVSADRRPEKTPADTAIINVKVHGQPDADCVLIKDNIISFVGKVADAGDMIDRATREIDGGNSYLLPGFCDSHVHLTIGAEHYQGCDVESVTSYAEFARKVGEFAEAHPELEVIHVYGLHYMDPPIIPAADARQRLDSIVKERPLFVYAHDLHTGWANTAALKAAEVFHKMPPWPAIVEQLDLCGNIELDDKGFPSGELREPEAYFLVEGNLRTKFPLTVEQKREYLREACGYLARLGITSVHNMGLALPEEDIELLLLLLELEERGELPVRVSNSFSVVADEHMFNDIDCAARIRNALRDAGEGLISLGELHKLLVDELKQVASLRHQACLTVTERHPEVTKVHPVHHTGSKYIHDIINDIHVTPHIARLARRLKEAENKVLSKASKVQLHSVKLFMDGVIEKDTAYRSDLPPVEGIPAFDQEELEAVTLRADRLGLQVAAHCIGDASVGAVLDSVSLARQTHKAQDVERQHCIRHRIEHIELCKPEDISRFAHDEVIASMQPLHERPPVTLWHKKVPESKWSTAFPWQGMLEAGAKLTFGSDWPIVSCNCLKGLQRAVGRKPWKPDLPNQGVNFVQGVAAFSSGNAYSEYQEAIRGRVAPGMVADLALIAGELDSEAPSAEKLKCVCTVCDGRITFSALQNKK